MRMWVIGCTLVSMVGCATVGDATHGAEAAPAESLEAGLIMEYFDHSVRPQDDLYRFANGTWLDTFVIPADKSRYGSFTKLYDEAQTNLKQIIMDVSGPEAEVSEDERKVGMVYRSFMNQQRIETLGLKPLEGERTKIGTVESVDDFAEHMGHFSSLGVRTFLGGWIDQDAKNTTEYIIYLSQSGLGLPDRDYYSKEGDKFDSLRGAYEKYLAGLFKEAGRTDADEAASRLMQFETRMAATQWTRVKNRNRDLTYNKFDAAGLKGLAPDFAWARFFSGLGLEAVPNVVVRQPDYVTSASGVLASTPVEVLRDYLEIRLLSTYASRLHKAMVDLQFGFYGKVLRGARELEPRWKRGVSEVERTLGEVVGKIYVSRHFKPEAKARMVGLVDNLEKAFGEGINALEWMTDATKMEAQQKLGTFVSKIGYPDTWRSYEGLKIEADDLVGNAMRARTFEHRRELSKLGKPIDRSEWFMNPQTVNAYYNPSMNEIVFPAAILQPPFFNLEADDAVNYGAIGAVIGHELSHGFDDQGRKSDGQGTLRDWWTEQDAKEFEARAAKMVSQYGEFSPIEGMNVNGKLTLGENIGDLGGLTIAYRAYKLALGGQPAPVINGLTGEQRFFLGWAQMWACKYRDGELRQRLMTDPHAPTEYRVTGVVSNMPEFYEAFDVKEGDKLYRSDEERVKIW